MPLRPASVSLLYDECGQPLGIAEVTFASVEDAHAAMERDRQIIGKQKSSSLR